MIGDIAIGVVSNIAHAGLSKCFGAFHAPIRRRQTIERLAINPKDEKSRKFARALNDLRILFGNKYELYNEGIEFLFAELTRSGFPHILTESILSASRPDAAKAIFDEIYSRIKTETSVPKDKLYDAIETAVRAQYELLSADRALLEVIASRNKQMLDSVKNLQIALKDIKGSLGKSLINREDIANLRIKIARSLENKYRYVSVETNRGARKFTINRLFIESRFGKAALSSGDIASKNHKNWTLLDAEANYVSYSVFRTTFHRAIILGDPGGGKSTTVQNICFELSRALGLATQYVEKDIESSKQKMPFRIVLRSFDSRRRADSNLTILGFLIDDLAEGVDEDRATVEQFVRYSLINGTAVVLFDGLDEVLDVSVRREYVALVEQFASQYPAAPVLVTSRFVGYMDAPLAPEFDCLSLARFQEEEVREYARKLLSVVKSVKESKVEKDVSRFLEQTSKNASDLRENPLLLGLMVWLFSMKGDVPTNRPEIYRECPTLMFEKWDQNRGILVGIPSDFELLDLFGYIAHAIFGRADLEEGVSKDWLQTRMKEYFAKWYDNRARATEVAVSLVEFLTGRAWVMSEVGQNVFKFTHRTFLEYFFAKYVNAQVDTTKGLIGRIRPKIYDGQLEIINHLSLQMFTYREPRKVEQAIDELLTMASDARKKPWQSANAILFLAGSCEYLMTSEQKYKALTETLIKRVVEVGSQGESVVGLALELLEFHARERKDIFRDLFARVILGAAASGDQAKFEFIVAMLSSNSLMKRGRTVYNPWPRSVSNNYIAIMKELRGAIRSSLLKRAQTDMRSARLLLELCPNDLGDMVRVHGQRILGYRAVGDILIGGSVPDLLVRHLLAQAGMMVSFTPWTDIDAAKIGRALCAVLDHGVTRQEERGTASRQELIGNSDIFRVVNHLSTRSDLNADLLGAILLCYAVWIDSLPVAKRSNRKNVELRRMTSYRFRKELPRLAGRSASLARFIRWVDESEVRTARSARAT
jgi:hypothetical protein